MLISLDSRLLFSFLNAASGLRKHNPSDAQHTDILTNAIWILHIFLTQIGIVKFKNVRKSINKLIQKGEKN